MLVGLVHFLKNTANATVFTSIITIYIICQRRSILVAFLNLRGII